MVTLAGVTKHYGPMLALAPLDLQIEPRRTTILIGPSGSGKSTILRLMTGLLWPDAGTVLFDGAPLTPANVMVARRRMGYVIQEGGLFPHLTAEANVALMARYLGRGHAAISQRVGELAGLAKLPRQLLTHYPAELSGGERQRVSLMRALMLDPDVLLLDEPLGALDPMIRYGLQTDLARVFRALGKTVVMVTHDMGEAAFLGDTIVLLRDGRVVQQGTIDSLLHSPTDPFVDRFINAQRSPLDAMATRQ